MNEHDTVSLGEYTSIHGWRRTESVPHSITGEVPPSAMTVNPLSTTRAFRRDGGCGLVMSNDLGLVPPSILIARRGLILEACTFRLLPFTNHNWDEVGVGWMGLWSDKVGLVRAVSADGHLRRCFPRQGR